MVNGMGIRHLAGMTRMGLLLLGLGFLVSGCMQQTIEPASDANLTPRDRKLLANPPYAEATIPEPYLRHIVDYHRKEGPGTIVIDPDARYLYYVLPKGKAIRYGVTVGEEALVWSGVAKVGRMVEWPTWTPTASERARLGKLPDFVGPGPHNPMGARGMYLYQGNKDTLYRIHGTNQPEYIGSAISSGCIRMTNEDVIDLYNRVKLGTPVVVLKPSEGDSPYNPRMALGGLPEVN
jgi:lipoprotein-anchoring transpeptidase ErfK/SrfK